jgi:hypothetical protein
MKIKTIILALILLTTGMLSHSVMAATANSGTSGGTVNNRTITTLQNPLKNVNNVEDLLYTVVDVAIFIGVIIATLMFVFIGFKFVMAQGNQEALKEARRWFFYTVIGTAVLISSKVIVEVVKNTFTQAGIVDEKFFNKPN